MRTPLSARPLPNRLVASLASLTLVLALVAAPAPAGADEQDERDIEMIQNVVKVAFDVGVLRPMGTLQVFLGAAVLPVAYTLAYPAGPKEDVLDILLKSPAEYTFARPLGEF